jgi:hypothetical protein
MEDDKIIIFHRDLVGENSLASRLDEELGLDWDIHSDSVVLGNEIYSEAGLVNIEELIGILTEMQGNGATHVACDWHCDHQELDVHGVAFTLATADERKEYFNRVKRAAEDKKQAQINSLENQLKSLKGE